MGLDPYGSVWMKVRPSSTTVSNARATRSRQTMAPPTRTPRSRWIEEGLRALAAGGPDAVRIEPLAQALGVTKGGFYWHFDDRRALLDEMLDTWERASIDEVIERVEGEGGDARAKLRRLARSPPRATGCCRSTSPSATGPGASRRSPSACERVDNRRMDYMRSLFGPFCPDDGRRRGPLPCSPSRCSIGRPLHRRRSRRAQPRGRARASPQPPAGVARRCALGGVG